MLEIVADLQSALLSPSLKRRDNALERVRHIVFPDQSHEAISKDDQNVTLAMIADCYFSSYYHEKKWFWDLQECILQSCCNNDYLKEIHKFFHNKVHVNTNHSGQQLMRLYNLYIKIIQTQCENNSFDSLDTVEFLGTIIDLSINCSKTYTTRISSSFKSACFKSRNFLEVCWLNWTSDSSKYPFGALGIVLITEGSGSLRELYLVRSAFVKTVILAKPGTVVLSNCLSLYLSTLKQTDWEENVEDGSGSMESGIMKMLKKAPEGFSSTAAFLLSSICQIDVSGMVMEGAINLAVRMIKSIDILVRQSGEDFTVNLIAKSGRSEARARIFSVLLECLLGKGQSAVVELSQKMSVCLLIDRCIHHCDSTFFIDIIEMIFNLVEKENDENIRTLSFYWIGILSGRASNISQRCLPWLRDKIVNSKGKLLSLPLIAVLAMVEKNPEAIAHIASITDELIGIVVDANLKPSLVSSEGVIACKLVFDLWKYDNELQEKCKSSKFSSVVLDPNSFLYHENLSKYIGSGTNKLSKRENFGMDLMRKYVVKSLGCIFSDSINFLSSRFTSILLQSTCSKPLQVLLNCCIHPDVTVRSCFTNYAEFVISSLDAIRVMLLDSLWDKLVGIDQECHFLNRSDTSKIELDEGKVSSNLHDYRNMVQICCSYQKNLTIENLIRLLPSSLSVICHPLVSPSRKGSLKLWIKVTQSFDTVLESLTDEQMMLVAKSISDSLFANAISSLRATRQCSYHALYVLLNSKRSAFSSQKLYAILYENLASVIGTILKDGRFWSLSTSDHKLYNNFQEEISLAISNIETTTNVSKVSNSDRRKEVTKHSRKANFGGDSTFEEDWAERLRLEKIRKTVSEQLTDSMNSIRNRLKIRFDEIEKIILETRYTIDLLKRFIDGQREMSKMFLPEILLESVLPYFKYESMRATCQACLHDICSSLIEPDFSQLLSPLEDTLRLFAIYDVFHLDRHERHKLFKFCCENCISLRILMASLYSMLSRPDIKIDPSTVSFVVHACSSIFCFEETLPGCSDVFKVASICWLSNDEETSIRICGKYYFTIRNKMMWVTLRFLSKFPLDPKSENVLSALIAETISLRTEDWVLLLHENGLLNEVDSVRLVCLKSIANLLNLGKEVPNECLILLHFAAYDENPTVAEFSRRLRTNFQLSVMSNTFSYLRPLMDSPERRIRHCSARAIAGLLDRIGFDPNIIDLDSFFNEYNSYLPPNSEKKGNTKVKSGRISIATQDGKDDGLFFREALAIFLRAVGDQRSLPPSEGRTEDLILSLVKFIVDFGSVDLDTKVRAGMVDAGRKLVDAFGLYYSDSLLELLESALQTQTDDDVYTADNKRAAIVVIMGECAKHLRANDPKVLSILLSLVEALKTPSESVQRSVADCIAPLFHTIIGTSDADRLVVLLLDQVTNGKTYGDRRGAAFGLCGAIKGLGVSSVKKYGLISKLIDYVSTGSASCRQGSLFAIECLSERMCLLFEPYIITLMPLILKSVSNSSDHVREAAKGTVRIVMKNLSTYGVKQVLTPVLASLPNETAWKSRQEAIRLLGMMAHCAPRQLAGSLPQIIPILVQSGSDIHPRVKESAKEAMQDILSVIRNPEVSHLSPTLLNGLVDPANKAKDALESLLRCEFIHAIDVASLAIIIPILSKSLRDRSGDLKKKAAIITGNIVGMVLDKRIIAPYVPHLLPGLKECLIDPIPEVRATSAKALAKLISGVGETKTEDILPWLEETMVTDNSPVERSGAAQALAEICHVLDNRRRGEIFYKSLILYHDSKSSCREGLMWYLTFLPAATGEDFCEFIEDALPVLLAGLSDDSESVCEVAMRAGQVLISRMGLSNALDILPDLLDATLSEDWRIRTSSLSLLGDLLFLIGDTKGINFSDFDETDDDMDGGYSTSESKVSLKIRSHIGNDCFYQVLSTIYIVRADVQIEIRQNALKIWKSIVSNSPKMLVDIIPTLIPHLMKLLSVESEEIRLIGGKALGEAVSKMGDRILPAVVPYLKEGLQSNDESRRQGVCAGLAEVLSACNRKQAELYVEVLIPALQFALCDKSDVVCNQAARAFMILYKIIGNQAIDEIIPVLLHQLEVDQESEESVLRGLREIVRLRPRDLLEYLLPVLLKSPISSSSAQALGVVVEVGNTQLTYHLGTIIPALVSELIIANTEAKDNSTTRLAAIKMAGNAVVGAITSFGVHEFISDVGKQMDGEVSGDRCRWGCWMVGRFISLNKSDFSDYIPILLKYVLSHAASGDVMMLEEVRDTLLAFANCVPLDKLVLHIDFIRNCINSTASTARHRTGGINYYSLAGDFLLPLLTIPKSADPFITIYLHALMNGFAELRELAAEAIAELVTMTDFSVLKPLVIKTTGPLIRVIGERFPSNVKAAILKALQNLISKVGIALKAFVPQLQTTFVKAVSDPSREVRARAASALAHLIGLSSRIEPLINDLVQLCNTAESNAIKSSGLEAIYFILSSTKGKLVDVSFDKVHSLLISCLVDEDELVQNMSVKCFYFFTRNLDDNQVQVIQNSIYKIQTQTPGNKIGKFLGTSVFFRGRAEIACEIQMIDFSVLYPFFKDDKVAVRVAASRGAALIFGTKYANTGEKERFSKIIEKLLPDILSASQDVASGDIRVNALYAIVQLLNQHYIEAFSHFHSIIPLLLNMTKDPTIRVKKVADLAMKIAIEGSDEIEGKDARSGISVQFNTYLSQCEAGASRHIREYYHKFLAMADLVLEESDILSFVMLFSCSTETKHFNCFDALLRSAVPKK